MFKDVTIPRVKKLSIKTDYNPEEHTTKRSLSINVEVSEWGANALLELTKSAGSWYITIGVEEVQMPFEEPKLEVSLATSDPT